MHPKPIIVLLVEDSASDADLLQESLEDIGTETFHFTVTEGLGDALLQAKDQNYDIMLLDLSLPDSFGTQTFLRARAEAPRLPIVVLTGTDSENLGLEAVRHGIQDYLIKGQADGRQVARSIRYAIERKKVELELQAARELLAQQADNLDKLVHERTRELQETVAELEHFSYSITHDMRAPLRAMQGFADLMLKEECVECQNPRGRMYLGRIITAAERMDHLITDALQFSQVVRTHYPLHAVDPQALLRGILDSYPNLQQPQAEVTLNGAFPKIMANEAGLTQCFSNVLANAVKFVSPGTVPRVTIRSEETGNEMVRIWIEDNGIGIPKAAQEKIFHMFQQLSKDYSGTGIGLALVRKAAQRMNGTVGVESEPGKGSRFWVEFKKAV